MKKIFSLFMAALFSMTMLAGNKIYFKASQDFWNWLDGGVQSATAIYAWDGEGHIADWPGIRMTKVEGEQYMWVAEIAENFENAVFVRVNAEGDFTEKGLKTKDLVIPTDGKNLYTITAESVDWSNPDLWDKGIQEGEWSVFVPQTPAKFYITGILGAWNPDAIASTADSYTVKNVPAGHHAMKVTVNGTWDTAKGLEQISESNKYLYPDQDGNVCFFLSEEADVTVTYIAGESETFTVSSEKFALPSVKLVGAGEAFGDWDETKAIALAPAADELSASVAFTLSKDQHVYFLIIRAGEWLTQEGENNTDYGLNRGWTSVSGLYRHSDGKKCLDLAADADGEYTITWTYATGTLNVTFPNATGIENTNVNAKAVKRIVNGQLVIIRDGVQLNVLGQQF